MAQIITVTNQKGGVGKTTTAAALICGLHQRGASVLGIDLDPQGNLCFSLGQEIGVGYTTYDVLTHKHSIYEAISHTSYGDVIPSDVMLSVAEVEFTAPRREFMLAEQIKLIEDRYDFIIIDTPPALNLLTINAYVASTALIIPMEPEILSLVGISQLRDTFETIQKSYNPNLKIHGILLNQYNHRLRLHREVLDMAEEIAAQLNTQVFPTKIRGSVDVAAAPAHGQSILTYRPHSNPAMDFRKLVDAVAGEQFPRPRQYR